MMDLKNSLQYLDNFPDETHVLSIAPMANKLCYWDIVERPRFKGIYFLCINNRPVYIGQSIDLESRLVTHKNKKDKCWDKTHLLILDCEKQELNAVERIFIDYFKPVHNRNSLTLVKERHYKCGRECLMRHGIDIDNWDQSKRWRPTIRGINNKVEYEYK